MSAEEKLTDEYVRSFMGKIFYFCLRKTGNRTEAEDLSSEIGLAVLSELRRGVTPEKTEGWIWQIAKNRYAKWAQRKHQASGQFVNADVNDMEIEDNYSIDNEWICREDLSLLRRELAFIARDYRQIVVAFYIEDRSIHDISASLDLPEGTVKSKLFRARAILKEGMNMARTFGKMSYNPENLSFCMNGLGGKNGEPWCFLTKSLDKNILLAAYRTPSTAEELAMELDVALPYMEEELETLVNATLLVKKQQKYETNFFIFSSDAQEKLYSECRRIAPELTEKLIDIYHFKTQWLDKHHPDWRMNCQSEEDMRWAGLTELLDAVNCETLSVAGETKAKKSPECIGSFGYTVRPNGGEWDIIGFEDYEKAPFDTSRNGCIHTPEERDLPPIDFCHFTFGALGRKYFNRSVTYHEATALLQIIKGDPAQANESIVENLIEKGYLKQDGKNAIPTFSVIRKKEEEDIPEEIRAEIQKKTDAAIRITLPYYDFIRDCISAEMPKFIVNREYQIDSASSAFLWNRGIILEEAIKKGFLIIPQEEARIKMLGAVLKI